MDVNRGDELVLEIVGLTGEGKSVARHDGMVFFVENAVPGDTVRARVWKRQKKFAEARALELLKPSSSRIESRCRHFGVCGGCKWQNLAYKSQISFKAQQVADSFVRIGGFENPVVLPPIGCDDPFFYRNKMEFTFSRYRWLSDEEFRANPEQAEGVALGLHIPKRYDKVLDLQECWLQSEISSAILNTVRDVARTWNLSVYSPDVQQGFLRHLVIREGKRTGGLMVNLVTSSDWPEGMEKLTDLLVKHFPQITTIVNNITDRRSMVATGDREIVRFGSGFITEKIGDFSFRISANSFFQTNTLQAEKLYRVVRDFAALRKEDVVYDLYCGTGSIAIFISDAVERVIGIEVAESAIADAEINSRLNHIPNCFFLQGELKDRLVKNNEWLKEHPRPTAIVTDPPRTGMHQKVVDQIARLGADRIVYVSCNPATQARDAKQLAAGGYQLVKIQPVDMFPHTDHVESVALFSRRNSLEG